MSQNGPKTTSLMTSQKIHNPQPKIFFRVQTRILADLFEPLTLLEPPGFDDFCKKNQQFSFALPTP